MRTIVRRIPKPDTRPPAAGPTDRNETADAAERWLLELRRRGIDPIQ